MRRFVYDAKNLFAEIESRLVGGERIITYECDFPPETTPARGKLFFYKTERGFVVGLCTLDNKKTVEYSGTNRDFKWLAKHKAIEFSHIPQMFNCFYRMDAIYSTTDRYFTYYVDNYGYYENGKFRFEIVKVGPSWRAYILEMPPFGDRDPALSKTHRLVDGDRHYVCVVGTVPTKAKMIEIAKLWANKELNYIKTGETF